MTDELYMRRALELAERGLGTTSPNPMVGCVVVDHHEIIGEGWHQQFGGAHAEVYALNSVKDVSRIANSTIYVTLEPCSFIGKTPACSDLLIRSKVKKVVVAAIDPNPRVSGNGIERLKNAGIEVEVGLLREESKDLNRRFEVNIVEQRPFIILKWAQTADGFIARENHDSKWISNNLSRQLVHKWRSEEDAILVGKNTIKYDDPALTVRDWSGRNPIRVVLDRNLGLSAQYQIMDQQVPTTIYNTAKSSEKENLTLVKISEDQFVMKVMQDLYQKEIGSVIVEGGSEILHSFIAANLWDEARVFTSEQKFGKGIKAPLLANAPAEELEIAEDRLSIFNRI